MRTFTRLSTVFSVSFYYSLTVSLPLLFNIANMGTARKLFRLFKSFNEYVKI